MKHFIINIVSILSIFFQSCNENNTNKEVTISDIVGRWESSDKAELVFNDDGTFSCYQMPAVLGYYPVDSFKNIKFVGNGRWKLQKGDTKFMKLYLDFDKVNLKKSCAFALLIAGEKGAFENKPPWYIFAWKEEAGGEKYKFVKK